MGQELLYAVMPRPALGAENLTYRRRVAKVSAKDDSKRAESKEQKFSKEESRFDDDKSYDESGKLGSHVDSLA